MRGRESILQQLKSKRVGVFVDDSNLYHAYQKYGWRIDIGKFKEFLKRYCDIRFLNYYVAVPEKSDSAFAGTQRKTPGFYPGVALL